MSNLPEFSRRFAAADLALGETCVTLRAEPGERTALARRFGLLSLDRLEATIWLSPADGGRIVALRGHYEADVVQTCVVSLRPAPATVRGDLTRTYGPTATPGDIDLGPDDDPVEPLEGGWLDAGEAVAQQLSLDLDPFPRLAAVEFEGFSTEKRESGAMGNDHPFAALRKLKRSADSNG